MTILDACRRFVLVAVLLLALAPSAHAGVAEGIAALNRGDYPTAFRELRPAAEAGDASAQQLVGWMYQEGRGAPKDETQALNWFRRAAEKGHAGAQNSLGAMYAGGRAGPQDYAEAVKWFRRSADQGDAAAQNNLGVMYAHGRGVPQSYADAVRWWQLAADQGNPSAQLLLGNMYEQGQGVPKDLVRAHMWMSLGIPRSPAGAARDNVTRKLDAITSRLSPAQLSQAQRLAQEWKPKVK